MIKIIDDFYEDPDQIRNMALSSKYELISSGNYIGRDTIDRNIRFTQMNRIYSMFPDKTMVCSRFRSAVHGDTHLSFIHVDSDELNAGWHVLVYLSKDTCTDGLAIYNIDPIQTTPYKVYPEEAEPSQVIEYKYNRAVILDYGIPHSPLNHTGFGIDIATSRLMHIVEICDPNTSHYKYRMSCPGACVTTHDHPYAR